LPHVDKCLGVTEYSRHLHGMEEISIAIDRTETGNFLINAFRPSGCFTYH
jgi:hypothetical protein